MSTKVSIPKSYTFTVHHGSTGETIRVDADLDNIHVKEIPRIYLEGTADTKVAVTEMPRIEFAVKEIPRIEFGTIDVALKEIPSVRAHVPSHYDVGFSVLGIEIWRLSLCGESQVITEKYVPHHGETCE